MADFFVTGDDKRWDLVAKMLRESGHRVYREGLPTEKAGVCLPGFGTAKKDVLALAKVLPTGSAVFLGRADGEERAALKERGIIAIPLLEDEEYLAQNARATAEGCLAALIECTDSLLENERVLLCGYGNCGRAIAALFRQIGIRLSVFSREGSMARAAREGFEVYRAPGDEMGRFSTLVNTVPEAIFPPAFLDAIPRGTHFFQVASGFSGLSVTSLEERGILFHPLPGLPGLCAPKSEAEAILGCIRKHLDQFFHESE